VEQVFTYSTTRTTNSFNPKGRLEMKPTWAKKNRDKTRVKKKGKMKGDKKTNRKRGKDKKNCRIVPHLPEECGISFVIICSVY
jgi:hypothetical protein